MKTIDPLVLNLCHAIHAKGGRAFLVGGWVRDHLRGVPNVDYDLEVYGLEPARLRELLDAHGTVNAVGEAFTVYKVKLSGEWGVRSADTDVFDTSINTAEPESPQTFSAQSAIRNPQSAIDVSLPRRESKVGRGHRGFEITGDPWMPYEEAARRRDFTINAVMYDPLTDEFIDPFHGREDIQNRVIRAVDPTTFIEDSLRVLRAMQFAARFEFKLDPATAALCRSIDLSDLPAERIWAEVEKWLLQSQKPSIGFWAAIELGITEKLWPEIHALRGCPQEYEWHPEGWSFTELPFQPCVTGSAQSVWVDNVGGRSLREFLPGSTTNAAMIPVAHRTSAAESFVDTLSQSLTLTSHTGSNCLDAPSPLRPAILANVESLVWSFGTPAISANEIIRVVFKIPLDYVRSVVLDTVNDFEIVRRIIHPVAVYVVNMLASTQGASSTNSMMTR